MASDREITIARYADEAEWTLDVSDPATIKRLIRRGWEPFETSDPYVRFRVPLKAVQFRSRKGVESLAAHRGNASTLRPRTANSGQGEALGASGGVE